MKYLLYYFDHYYPEADAFYNCIVILINTEHFVTLASHTVVLCGYFVSVPSLMV